MNEIVEFVDPDCSQVQERTEFEGFEIKTDQQTIYIMISSCQSCCEDWGIYISPRNFDLVGEVITDICYGHKVMDPELLKEKLYHHHYEECNTVCVNITIASRETPIQIIAFNQHNGYYPHNVLIRWKNRDGRLVEEIESI